MPRSHGLVFSLDPSRTPSLCDHLAARGGRALAVGGCSLELVVEGRRVLGAIVGWDAAVPLKVERLALAIVEAGGILRRDLDAGTIRLAPGTGRRVLRIDSVVDLAPLRRPIPTLATRAATIGPRALYSVS